MADRDVNVRFGADVSRFVAATQRMAREVRTASADVSRFTRQHQREFHELGVTAGVAGGGIALGLGKAIASTISFDKAMSAVKAVTGATADAMNDLRDAALDAGARTAFSATEAAGAIENLVKAGISVEDVLGGGLRGALDLAAAGELDVASAAEVAATAMTQFGLAGGDVGHVADLLAAGAGKAQGGVQDMSMALAQSGLVASQMGLSIEETIGTLTAFASAGLLGSDAGTSFRTMMLRLANPTDEAKQLMADLGIEAYNAQGQFVGVAAIAGELQGALSGQSQATRDAALATIFGNDAIRAANVLYNQGLDGIREWTSAANDQGYAADAAATRLDNLAGDLEELSGAVETFLIGSGSEATGVLRLMTQATTGLVNDLSALPGPVQAVGFGMASLSAGTLGAVGAAGILIPRVRDARDALEKMGRAGQLANRGLGFLGRGGAYAAGAFLLAEGVHALAVKIDEVIDGKPRIDELTSALIDLANAVDAAAVAEAMRSVNDAARDGQDDIASWLEDIDRFGNTSMGQRAHSQLKQGLEDIDTALATIVESGNADLAREALERFASDAGVSVAALLPYLDDYESSLSGSEVAAKLAAQATGEVAGEVRSLSQEIDELLNKEFGLTGATNQLTASVLDWVRSVRDAKADGNEFATSLSATSIEGLANRQILQGLAEDAVAVAGEMAAMGQDPVAAMANVRQQLIDTAVELGFNRDEATDLFDVLLHVGELTVAPTVDLDTNPAWEKIKQLTDFLDIHPLGLGTNAWSWEPAPAPDVTAGVENVLSGRSGASGGSGGETAAEKAEREREEWEAEQDAHHRRMFEHDEMTLDEYIGYLDSRLAAEEQFSEDYFAILDERERVTRQLADALDAIYDDQIDQLRIQYDEGRITGDMLIESLMEAHQRAVDFHGYWSEEAHAIREEIRAINGDLRAGLLDTIQLLEEQRQFLVSFYELADQRSLTAARESTVVVQAGATTSYSPNITMVTPDPARSGDSVNQRMRDDAFLMGN